MDYTGAGVGVSGATLAATGAYGSSGLLLLTGVLLLAGAMTMLGVSGRRRRADRQATRS